MSKIQRAIVSVTDKTGLVEFCKTLSAFGIEILSTGGTAKLLREHGIKTTDVAAYTGSPEVMDGRLKTIHPKIEGGILSIRSNPKHQSEMEALGILPIDLVVVNLYAFEKTAAKEGCTLDEAVENIDIGGPTMLRAAAKNHRDVTVVVDPEDYPRLAEELKTGRGVISEKTNFELAVKVFQTMARYDGAVSNYLSRRLNAEAGDVFPQNLSLQFERLQGLRYGENPHQKAAYYRELPPRDGVISRARQLHGKELSFNNIIDLEAALECVREFEDPACVIVKHTNPCGVAVGKDLRDAFVRARECDPASSFGGIIGMNRRIDAKAAQSISETFFECVIAPGFEEDAFKLLEAKKNIRLMVLDTFGNGRGAEFDYKRVGGGLLVQEKDRGSADLKKCSVPTKRKPTGEEYVELDFAWKVVKHVKSNAIVFTRGGQTLGIGAGQMSRVDSVKIAVMKANKSLKGSVLASDAFFPFRDGIDEAAKNKITAILQPGGSVRDDEVVKAADEHGLAMVFTGMRHFKH
ncbi:MAG: bifunctional phosphoribosylaminoimidazolecarboxamide formyltransferase/IMP cyclohydrolase [Deltaproteobacteria bacterium]|nr:bifunctional phosphoribosylaminoimidazolecarboxamide formyltransferase/IMP cyclohydrolase [Deltaproteobacteria bacterium]